MDKMKTAAVPIKGSEIEQYITKYGKNNKTYKTILNKLEMDLHRMTYERRAITLEKSKKLFDDNLEYFKGDTDAMLFYLRAKTALETGNRYSTTKYQFYYIFRKMGL